MPNSHLFFLDPAVVQKLALAGCCGLTYLRLLGWEDIQDGRTSAGIYFHRQTGVTFSICC
jgi:hypothetical protein